MHFELCSLIYHLTEVECFRRTLSRFFEDCKFVSYRMANNRKSSRVQFTLWFALHFATLTINRVQIQAQQQIGDQFTCKVCNALR